ncbi:MAG: hypothetical protein ABIH04_01415 [Planctomycetota bacterium]
MIKAKARDFGIVMLVSVALVALTYFLLRDWRFYGPIVAAMALLPLFAARLRGLQLKSLVPDIIFGGVDTGLLTLGAVIGASEFGIIGAIVGGVVADAITDAIAGFFEGGVAEWLRSKGIEESRTALGSACGKMTGCLAGSGFMLCILQIANIQVLNGISP